MVARRAEPVAEFQERHLNVSRMLVDHGVPISVVAELVNDRALLALDPARLEEQFGILCDVWPNRTSLIRTIQQYPFVLSDESWLARLPRSTTDLTDMGWSGAEAAKMIIERPDIVYVRRFELHNTMKAIKRILGTDDQANFMQFFAKNPAALLEWQTRFLPRVEQLVELTGMASEEVIRFVVQHDAAFKLDIGAMKITMGVIHEFCGADGGEMAREIVRSQPQMLTMTTTRVDDSLRVLRILGISPEEIARYPKAFMRHPYRIVGPRTQFVTEHVERRGLKPATYLCCGEESFETKYVLNCVEGGDVADERLEHWRSIRAGWEQRGAAAERARGSGSLDRTQASQKPKQSQGSGIGKPLRGAMSSGQPGLSGKDAPTATEKRSSGRVTSANKQQSSDKQYQKPARRKPNRFFKKRLTRIPRIPSGGAEDSPHERHPP